MPGPDRGIGAGAELDHAGGLVPDPERDAPRVGEADRRGRDLAQDLVGVERGGDELDELDQRAQLVGERVRVVLSLHPQPSSGFAAIH
jgi:hypothetical protein